MDNASQAGSELLRVTDLHAFYGEQQGLRIARKHAGWYLADTEGEREFLRAFHQIDSGKGQLAALRSHFLCRQQREALAA